jgi:hypothetical protein
LWLLRQIAGEGKTAPASAEIAKRLAEHRFSIDLYANSTEADPQSPASWIDRAKLLDGFGHYAAVENVLQPGILKVQHTEQYCRELLREYQRMNASDNAWFYLGSGDVR